MSRLEKATRRPRLSVHELPLETRIQERTLRRYLARQSESKLSNLAKISRATGVSADYLVGNVR
mgnify:CR=1 FL=1